MDTIILHGNVLTPDGILEDGAVCWWAWENYCHRSQYQPWYAVRRWRDWCWWLFVLSGLIGAHTHGGKGFDFMTCTASELDEVLA